MFLSIISIIADIAYIAILKLPIYTDRVRMPRGKTREWHRSPVDRLYTANRPFLWKLEIVLVAISVILAVMVLCGVQNRIFNIVRLVSIIASTVVFFIILSVTSKIHPKY